jgi:hypothetical protein
LKSISLICYTFIGYFILYLKGEEDEMPGLCGR